MNKKLLKYKLKAGLGVRLAAQLTSWLKSQWASCGRITTYCVGCAQPVVPLGTLLRCKPRKSQTKSWACANGTRRNRIDLSYTMSSSLSCYIGQGNHMSSAFCSSLMIHILARNS